MEIIQNKNILVAGATGGIGSETAKMLKQSGANLFITGRDATLLREIQTQLEVPAHRCFTVDICREDQVATAAANIHEQIDQLDVLINAVGIGIIKPSRKIKRRGI